MNPVTQDMADYIIAYYSDLLTPDEKIALRHCRHTFKLGDQPDAVRIRMYIKSGWISEDPLILNYLKDGYHRFALNCAERIVKESPHKVFFNLCPVCKRLARTPQAKQCRYCGHDWH